MTKTNSKYYDYLIVTLLVGVAFYAGFTINKTSDSETNIIDDRLRQMNEDSVHKIDSLFKELNKSMIKAETIIDNTKTIVKKEQQIKNEYIQNSYLLMSMPDSAQMQTYDSNLQIYEKRLQDGYYSGHNN